MKLIVDVRDGVPLVINGAGMWSMQGDALVVNGPDGDIKAIVPLHQLVSAQAFPEDAA